MTDSLELDTLTRALTAALRRDADALEVDGAPDLSRLADKLDQLLERSAEAPKGVRKRALLNALEAVQTFHARVSKARLDTATAIDGADQRRLARHAYVQAERYAAGRGA